jgi:hypothetical protein
MRLKKIQTTLILFQMFISITQSVIDNGKNTRSSCSSSSTNYSDAELNMTQWLLVKCGNLLDPDIGIESANRRTSWLRKYQ